jgi:hypothetical protein
MIDVKQIFVDELRISKTNLNSLSCQVSLGYVMLVQFNLHYIIPGVCVCVCTHAHVCML